MTSSDASGGEDIDLDSVSVTVIPTASAPPPAATEDDPIEDQNEQPPVLAMFTALSNCSNLHPDPDDQDNEEEAGIQGSRLLQAGLVQQGDLSGGMPPALPGSGGWITAENMHEFVDEDGNWIGGGDEGDDEGREQDSENLGPGAGTVRPREDGPDGDAGDAGTDDTKWRRTS